MSIPLLLQYCAPCCGMSVLRLTSSPLAITTKHCLRTGQYQHAINYHRRSLSTSPGLFIAPSSTIYGGNWLSDPENKGKRQIGVNFDTLGSWNHRLDLEVDVEQSIKSGRLVPHIDTEDIGTYTVLGRRKENEDRAKVANKYMYNVLQCNTLSN